MNSRLVLALVLSAKGHPFYSNTDTRIECVLQYIRKLLFADLDKTTIERVLRQLRKLPWSECETYLLKCFMKVYKGKYSQVHLIASLTAGLSRYHDAFAVAVVDEVMIVYLPKLLYYISGRFL